MAKKKSKSPYGSSTNCFGCHYVSAKPQAHGIFLCSACVLIEEPGERGTSLYVETIGQKGRKFVKLVARR